MKLELLRKRVLRGLRAHPYSTRFRQDALLFASLVAPLKPTGFTRKLRCSPEALSLLATLEHEGIVPRIAPQPSQKSRKKGAASVHPTNDHSRYGNGPVIISGGAFETNKHRH